jgi:DNA-binding transcriptional LysR family regulator
MMNIAELEAFVSVIREGTFTRAANILNLSQPALSRRVANLEVEAGGQLVWRHRGRVALTPMGAALLPHAEAAVAAMRDVAEAAGAIRSGAVESIVIAAAAIMCGPDLIGALRKFQTEYPAVKLQLKTGHSRLVSQLVRRGEATMGLRFRIDPDPQLISRELRTDRMCIICAPDHHLAGRTNVTPAELANETWIAVVTDSAEPDGGVKNTVAEYGFKAGSVISMDDLSALRALVEAGFGVGLTSLAAVQSDLDSKRLATIVARGMPSDVAVVMLVRMHGSLSTPARRLSTLIEQAFSNA